MEQVNEFVERNIDFAVPILELYERVPFAIMLSRELECSRLINKGRIHKDTLSDEFLGSLMSTVAQLRSMGYDRVQIATAFHLTPNELDRLSSDLIG